MKDPAFLFYPQDFFMGTSLMTFEDRGKYITILCVMHQKGHLSEETIRFLVGSVSDSLRAKFMQDENDLWYNPRLDAEILNRKRFVESRANNGKLGGRPRKEKPLAEPTQNLSVNTSLAYMEPTEDVNESEDEINLSSFPTVIKRFDEQEIIQFFAQKNYGEAEGKEFYNHYSAQGWVTGSGLPIVNWKLKAENWHKEQLRRNHDAISKQSDSRGKGAIDFSKYEQLRMLQPSNT